MSFKTMEASWQNQLNGRVQSGCLWGRERERGGQGLLFATADLVKPWSLKTIHICNLDTNKNFLKTRLKEKIKDTTRREVQYHKPKKCVKPYFIYYHYLESSEKPRGGIEGIFTAQSTLLKDKITICQRASSPYLPQRAARLLIFRTQRSGKLQFPVYPAAHSITLST